MNWFVKMVIDVCFEVCELYVVYVMSYDVVMYYCDEVVLLCKMIFDELLLCYNGMFVSVFELLIDVCE